MGFRRLMAVSLATVLVAAACGNDDDGDDTAAEAPAEDTEEEADGGEQAGGEDTGSVNVLNAMEPEEADAMQAIMDELIAPDVDYQVEIEQSGNFEEDFQIRSEGGTLDVALLPQPGQVADAVDTGAVALEDMGFDIDDLEATFGENLLSLVEVDGKHYGMPSNVNLKSMIWYAKPAFDAAGYEIPETWDDLIALSDQIVADGGTPWCVGYESEGATGWPATDWMEDIMLRTAGTDVYDQWWQHEIPFDDPDVQNAAEVFGEVMFADGYVLGGADQTPSISFGDAPGPLFEEEPGCFLHRQASFITAFFPEDAEVGTDVDWFPVPPIEEEGTLFGGEFMVTFRDAPEVRDFIDRFVSEDVQCAQGGEQASSRISPNVNVGPECYANDILADASEILTTSLAEDTGRFDASDLMPTEVGSGSFWSEMMAYMQQGPDSVAEVLGNIEQSWPQ